MVNINYPTLDSNTLDSIKQQLKEKHQRLQYGTNNNWDFDSLVQNQNGARLVGQICLHEINNFRNSQQDISYLIFFNRGTSPVTGAIMLSSALCEKTGLQYAIAYLNRQSQTIERVKWGRLCNASGDLDGDGILLTDNITEEKSIKSASEAVATRRGKVKLVLAYSSPPDLEQKLREDLSKKGTELKVLFNDKR